MFSQTRRGVLQIAGSSTLLLAPGLAACAPRGAGDVAPPAAKIVPGTKVSVLIKGGFYSEPQDVNTVQPVLKGWQQTTGLTIDPVDVGTDTANEKLQVLMASGTPPDVVGLGTSQDPLGMLLLGNALVPLDPLIKRDKFDLSDHFPYSLEHYRARNTQWGMPQAANPVVMFHNRDLLTRAGLQPPPASWKAPGWDWNDFVASAQKMNRPEGTEEDPRSPIFGAGVTDNEFKTAAIAVWSHGGELFDKEFTKCTLDSPQAVEGLQFLSDLVNRHRVNATPAQMQGTNIRTLFRTGRVGLLGWGQALAFVDRIEEDKPGFAWGVHAFPKGRAGRFTVTVGSAYALIKAGTHQTEAWELVKFLSGREFLRVVSRDGRGGISPRKSVMAELTKVPSLPSGFLEATDLGESARRWPLLARWPEIATILGNEVKRLWPGDVAVRQLASEMVTQINSLLKDRI
ncbi:MAG: ABC transporter substrate-binding protein [Chloroflexota bacterium]